ncbi:hypothetical protein BJ983_005392 [Actinomycetospora corticicola]|uniref:Polysaccharide lyase-like protein n=1 Tax=Actinomycetospora corticicola TaxID=663602 RepID=A0A7Y9E1M4_9PSEU|nr:hypothetical protein [Actinomycetospora corticicola]
MLARRRAAATGAVVAALLLAGTTAATAGPGIVTPGGETWAAELALEGGDDTGVVLADGAVRPATPRTEGVLTVAPRRLLRPAAALDGTVTADLPPGTSVDLQARGLDAIGQWGPWLAVRDRAPARFAGPTSEVQVRLRLRGAADGSAVPAAREVWLTSETAEPAPPDTATATPPTIATDRPRVAAATTTSPTSPATTTSPISAPSSTAGLIWDGSIATKGLGGFKDTPYNITGSSTVTVIDGPPKAIRFTVPSGSQRAEIEPDVDEFGEGETRYFRLTYTLPPSFPLNPSGFQLATQWKNDGTGSPPLELRIEDGTFRLGGGFGRPGGSRLFATDIAPAITGRPVDLVVGIVFSSDPAKGRVDVWVDEQQKLAGFRPPGGTLYPGKQSYWKVGLYRDTGNAGTATADLGVARLGETYESVAGGPAPSTTTSSPTASPSVTSTASSPTSPTPTVRTDGVGGP